MAKIYKLYCDDGHFYFGSTKRKYLACRLSGHKMDSKKEKYKNNKSYSHINMIGWDRVKIILVEEFEYTSRDDLRRRENVYIVNELKNPLCLNHNRSLVTDQERLEMWNERRKKIQRSLNLIMTCECGIEHTVGRTKQHNNSLKHRLQMEKSV